MKDKSGLNLQEPITRVTPLDEYVLRVVWKDGLAGEVDLREHVHASDLTVPLRDPTRFRQVRPGADGSTADFGDGLEIPGELLRRKVLEVQGRLMSPEAFKAWKTRYGLSLSQAAQALGITRGTVSAYASGERPIPRSILLTCKGWKA